tara:strand:+ start:2562 stop:3725 length:1164 start_codon:yes stop_codon:yes gene_type:complete
MIPYGRQQISEEDIRAVVEVLRSDFLTQGPQVPLFEQAVSRRCEVGYAVAVNSATSALHLSCLALGLGPGDLLWTTPITFVASANCALYCGASIDFVDIDQHTCNLSVKALEHKLRRARTDGRLPKVVVVVHLCGLPCDMDAIHALAKEYRFYVIEDASHAIGSRYQDRPVGDCRYSDITVFSFHPVKIITSAEGGMALTNNALLAEKMALLRSHGITRDPARMTTEPDGPWYYQQVELGFNYRMTDLQATLGLSQLNRLDHFIEQRDLQARYYDEQLQELPLKRPESPLGRFSARHLYVIRLDLETLRIGHLEVFERLRAAGIGVNLHYIPVHLQPYYQALGFQAGSFPVAEDYYRRAISLPIFPGLTRVEQDRVVRSLREALVCE